MKKNIFLFLSLMNTTIFCADKPQLGGSGGTPVSSAPRGSISGRTVSTGPAPRENISGTTQQSWFRSLFRPDERTLRKVTRRPQSTTIEYGDDKTLENISPYGTEMTYDPGTLRPQKEIINIENKMPAVRAGESGYVRKTTYYPQTGKKITYYGGTNTPKGSITYTKETEFPARKPVPVNTNPSFLSRKWSDFMNWLNSR